MTHQPDEQLDEILEYIAPQLIKGQGTVLKTQLLQWSAKRELKARRDEVSDAIIECYDHDSPLDIAADLINKRHQLEAKLRSME